MKTKYQISVESKYKIYIISVLKFLFRYINELGLKGNMEKLVHGLCNDKA